MQTTIRKNLSNLVRHGVDSWWIDSVGKDLLRLNSVRARFPDGVEPEEEQLFEALREFLREAIARLGSTQSQILLRVVLGLEPGTLQLSTQERREKAGREFRRGKQPVTWGTIRSYHERHAVDQLAEMIVGMEQGASTPPLFDIQN
jgi:hypothetical protein